MDVTAPMKIGAVSNFEYNVYSLIVAAATTTKTLKLFSNIFLKKISCSIEEISETHLLHNSKINLCTKLVNVFQSRNCLEILRMVSKGSQEE